MIRSDSQTSEYKISKFIVRNILLNKLMVIHVHLSQLKNKNCKKLRSFLLKIKEYKQWKKRKLRKLWMILCLALSKLFSHLSFLDTFNCCWKILKWKWY